MHVDCLDIRIMANCRNPNNEDNQNNQFLTGLASLLQEHSRAQGEQIQQLIQAQAGGRNNNQPLLTNPIFKQFKDLGPQEFKGGADPLVAKEWVQSVKTIFDDMQLTDANRVRCAIFMFHDDARVWWQGARSTVDMTTLTWNGFKDVLYGKYFTISTRTRLAREFLELRQGSMSIVEYVKKFERGRYFVPMISGNAAEELKHFTERLNATIRRDVRLSGAQTYREAVDEAMLSEKDGNDIIKESQAKRVSYQGREKQGPSQKRSYQAPAQRRPQQQQRQNPNQARPQGQNQPNANAPRPANAPICQKCGKSHYGQCMLGTNTCFLCKRPGHFAKDCPQSKEPVKGRVFAMTHDQVDPDFAIVRDTGATHSFMSVSFMMKLRVLPDESTSEFCVSLPSGEELKSSSVMVDFDAIFGMDWLAQHEAIIDCKQRTVSLKDKNGKPFVYRTTSKRSSPGMISTGTSWQLLGNGCTGFLASLTGELEVQRPKLVEVEVVKDFPEVFPDDVAGLPQVREVEFGIELMSGTKPASKAPYRLAPTEMKELKDQLQELLDKGFIRPSVSPWGAPVLFVKKKYGSMSLEEHRQHLTTVLQILKEKQLYAKFTDALSCNSATLNQLTVQQELIAEFERMSLEVFEPMEVCTLAALIVVPSFLERIRAGQASDEHLTLWRSIDEAKGGTLYTVKDGIVHHRGRMWVPAVDSLRVEVMTEAHNVLYSIHSGMKIEHQRPAGLLKPLPIPTWKWEDDTMDFVVGFPVSPRRMNSIWVVVDKLTKSAHFIPVRNNFSMNQYTELYIREIVRLHGVPARIVSDRDPKFTSNFWGSLHRGLGTKLAFSTTFHPQTYGQSERVLRFGKKGKLSPRYIGPFEILEKVGARAYRVALPPNLECVHNVFHISMLRKYVANSSHVIRHEPVEWTPDLSYEEMSVQILDRQVRRLRNREIPMYMENGRLVLSDCHGTTTAQNNFSAVKLNYPSERLTSITGRATLNYEGVVSLKIGTNCGEYGPFGKENGSYRELCCHEVIDQFGGFYGSATSDNLASIGVYIKPITSLGPGNNSSNEPLKQEL
ncbi:uncharacterized protein [Henckelia pumila]|uniref:uncharacterized protein n=1 Tax=Henckelia pumila TaxID=405737 RepID=UPI003C6DD530